MHDGSARTAAPEPPTLLGDLRMPTNQPLRVWLVVGECPHLRVIARGVRYSFLPLQARIAAAQLNDEQVPSSCGHGCRLVYRAVALEEPTARLQDSSAAVRS